MIHPGSWSIFGIRLPEFGITEKISDILGRPRTYQGGSNIFGPYPQAPAYNPQPIIQTTPSGQVKGISTQKQQSKQPIGNQPASSQPTQNWYEEQVRQEQGQAENLIDIINREYENYIGQLTAEEQALPGRYATYKQAVEATMAPILTSLQEAQAQKTGELTTQEEATKRQAAIDLKQIHQLLQDLQRKQAGYLSAVGGWTSTVAPALAEQFGRKAFSSISDLQARRDAAIADIQRRLQNVNDFYTQKKQDFEKEKSAKLALLEEQLQQDLSNIRAKKTEAAEVKARQIYDAWSDFLNRRSQLALYERQWQNALELWKNTQNQNLTSALSYLTSVPTETTYTTPSTTGLSTFGELTVPTQEPIRREIAPVQYQAYNRKPGETEDEYLARIYGIPSPTKGLATWYQQYFG